MRKQGFTLIEFIVATSIFVVVMTVAIGSFVALTKVKIQMINNKNTQQKGRIATEEIMRYAKEANAVTPLDELKYNNAGVWTSYGTKRYKTLFMSYPGTVNILPQKFYITNPNPGTGGTDTGYLYQCDADLSTRDCTDTPQPLLGLSSSNIGTKIDSTGALSLENYFTMVGNPTPQVEINLNIRTTNGGNVYDDTLLFNNVVMLEGMVQ